MENLTVNGQNGENNEFCYITKRLGMNYDKKNIIIIIDL